MILRRTYQTASSRNRLWLSTIPDLSTALPQPLWRPFKQPNRVSDGVPICSCNPTRKRSTTPVLVQRGSYQVVSELWPFLVGFVYLSFFKFWLFILHYGLILEHCSSCSWAVLDSWVCVKERRTYGIQKKNLRFVFLLVLVWFLNLFIVLELLLNIKSVFLFAFKYNKKRERGQYLWGSLREKPNHVWNTSVE